MHWGAQAGPGERRNRCARATACLCLPPPSRDVMCAWYYISKPSRKLDETLYGIPRGSGVIGPFSQLLKDQAGDVKGTVIGVYGELSSHVLSFLKYLATRRARAYAAASGTDPSKAFGAFYWQYRRHFVLTAIRGWSRIRLRTSSAICHRRRHGRTDTASESKERAAGLRRARNAFDSHQRVARRS